MANLNKRRPVDRRSCRLCPEDKNVSRKGGPRRKRERAALLFEETSMR
jgi:hypothetical protein